jgi:mannosyltransferase
MINDTDIVRKIEQIYRMLVRWWQLRAGPWLRARGGRGYELMVQRWSDTPPHLQWFFFAFLLALSTRIIGLGSQSLWLDEGATWAEVTDKSMLQLLYELVSPDAAYPLYHVILKGWTALVGDSEQMLRLPSAVASAIAIAATTLLFERQPQRGFVLITMITAPYVYWHAYDAKVYAFVMALVAILMVSRPFSLLWIIVLCLMPFMHRLGLFVVALALIPPAMRVSRMFQRIMFTAALVLGLIVVVGIGMSIRAKSILDVEWRSPMAAFADLVTRFSIDRRWSDAVFGLPIWLWIMPFLALLIIGTVVMVQQARAHKLAALQLLLFAYVPVLVIGLSYGATPFFDARYAVMSLPAWVVLIVHGADWAMRNVRFRGRLYREVRIGRMILAMLIIANLVSLYEPVRGIFSGAPVKEEWRTVMQELAHRVTRDDLVVLHPAYTMPLYRYYRRVTPDPLPKPVVFAHFSDGYRGSSADTTIQREFQRRIFERDFNQAAFNKQRALLVIAPDHAAQIDPPIRTDSPYGWVGLYFQYPQRTWPCGGIDRYGVALMCQSFPSLFGRLEVPQPEKAIDALFADSMYLRGVTIRPLGTFYQAGGSIPITLFWQAKAKPARDYRMFVHLCQMCNQPPVAQTDGLPFMGYGDAGRTTTWRIDDPVHDARAIPIPETIEPGNYAIIVGVYDPDGVRLPITSSKNGGIIGADRLIVTTIRIIR